MARICSVIIVMLVCGVAAAQPGAVPGGQEAPPPDADPVPPPGPPVVAPDATTQQYEAAFDAMVRGDFAAAQAGFDAVYAAAPDPGLRASAEQLRRLAGELAARNARLVFGSAPATAPLAVTAGPVSEDDEPTGGRASFVVTTTLASLYTGIVGIDLLDVDDVRAGTLLVMGATAGGVLGSLYGTRGRTMTGGMADAWSVGLFAGAANALLLSGPLGLYDASSNASEKVQTFVLGSTWGMAAAGLLIADHYRPTRAQVSVTSTIGMMGVGSTLLSLAMLQPDNLDGDSFLTITAGGLDAGIGIGAYAAGKLDWSMSRARYVGLSAFLGLLAGGGTSLLIFSGSDNGNRAARVSAGIALAGLWGGFALGRHVTRDMAPDYRFRAQPPGTTVLLSPTRIKDAPGLALVGMF